MHRALSLLLDGISGIFTSHSASTPSTFDVFNRKRAT